jgi:hypothetical protein
MLLLNFGAPALEELAVLCFSQHAARWETVVVVTGRGLPVVVTGRGAACCQHCLTSFYVCCGMLKSVSRHEGLKCCYSFVHFTSHRM